MTRKTHRTAVVIIPPPAAWPQIQAIRRVHDHQYRRWMPHITLIYPFRPVDEFSALGDRFRLICSNLRPFEVTLAAFGFFEHSHRSCTIWLAPDAPEPVIQMQTELWRRVPDCSEVRDLPGGFTPHLSVGQASGRKAAMDLVRELEPGWSPLTLKVSEISLIARDDPPDDVFRVVKVVSLKRE